MGGVVLYVGSQNTGNEAKEIPTGSLNYMSEGHVPPAYYPVGFNGFMRKYAYGNPPAHLSWVLSDGTSDYHVDMSTQATNLKCNPTANVALTFTYLAASTAFAEIQQTRVASRIELIVREQTQFPYNSMGAWTWAQTATGFTATLVLHQNTVPTQFNATATLSGLAGDQALNSFTQALNDAIGVANVAIAHIGSNGTTTDVMGTVVVPTAPVPIGPQPVPLPPGTLPENPIIPFADCWERNGSIIWFYFGCNNTNAAATHIPAGYNVNEIRMIPTSAPQWTPETFAPGFSSFVHALPISVGPTGTANLEWILLNNYVMMLAQGASQECKATEAATIWINFSGNMPTTPNIIQQLEIIIASHVQGASLSQFSVNLNGGAPSWRMEITISRGPVSPWQSASQLYQQFYHATVLPTQLEQLTNATPIAFHGQPTSVERQGTTRPIPTKPVSFPTAQPVHKKLGGGAIFGIIVAVAAGIALIGAVVWYLRRNPPVVGGGFEKLIQ